MSPRPAGQTWPGQAVTKRPRPTVVHPELRPLAQALRVRAGTRCSPPVTAPACHGLAATVWPPPFGRHRSAATFRPPPLGWHRSAATLRPTALGPAPSGPAPSGRGSSRPAPSGPARSGPASSQRPGGPRLALETAGPDAKRVTGAEKCSAGALFGTSSPFRHQSDHRRVPDLDRSAAYCVSGSADGGLTVSHRESRSTRAGRRWT